MSCQAKLHHNRPKTLLPTLISFPTPERVTRKPDIRRSRHRPIAEGSPAVAEESPVVGGSLVGIGQRGISCMDFHELVGRILLVLERHDIRVTCSGQSSVRGLDLVPACARWNPENLVKRRRCCRRRR